MMDVFSVKSALKFICLMEAERKKLTPSSTRIRVLKHRLWSWIGEAEAHGSQRHCLVRVPAPAASFCLQGAEPRR